LIGDKDWKLQNNNQNDKHDLTVVKNPLNFNAKIMPHFNFGIVLMVWYFLFFILLV
jgi:hypothetical protein